MTNKTYNILKWVALCVLPAIATFCITFSIIWGLPYGEEIGATITALETLLGTLLGISSIQYSKKIDKE
jgi:hypothetical protein